MSVIDWSASISNLHGSWLGATRVQAPIFHRCSTGARRGDQFSKRAASRPRPIQKKSSTGDAGIVQCALGRCVRTSKQQQDPFGKEAKSKPASLELASTV